MRQIQKLRDRLLSTSAPMDKEQVSHTTNVSVMADTIAMIVDMQKEVEAQTVEYLKQKWEAMKLLD